MVSDHIRYTGTHKGEFQGIPATGKKVSFEGFLIQDFDVDNGKMSVGWIALNLGELLWKLRPMPHPKLILSPKTENIKKQEFFSFL